MNTFDSFGASHAAFLALLAVMAGARIFELGIARRLTKAASVRGEAPMREPMFVAMVLLHVSVFPAAALEVALLKRPFSPPLAAVSVAALLVALAVRIWTLRTLGPNWNVRIVKPAQVIATGPYRFIRHPNYAVVITELLFLPLFHGAYLTAAVVTLANAAVLASRIPAEERVLSTLAGYDEAMAHKPRFFAVPWQR